MKKVMGGHNTWLLFAPFYLRAIKYGIPIIQGNDQSHHVDNLTILRGIYDSCGLFAMGKIAAGIEYGCADAQFRIGR
jgi:hypothetical protein